MTPLGEDVKDGEAGKSGKGPSRMEKRKSLMRLMAWREVKKKKLQ